jgi:glycerol-1-phosphate dehydrogenase [NAD(P)+]
VHQVLARPTCDEDGLRLLGTALFLNGVAMELAGSSRPASGSEHLLSHALDAQGSALPHGLQVAVTSLVSLHLLAATTPPRRDGGDAARLGLQAREALVRLEALGAATGLWEACAAHPLSRRALLEAVATAPTLRPGHFTVLSTRDARPEVALLLERDELLQRLTRP